MNKQKIEKNLILKLCFEFSLQIIAYCEELEKLHKYVIARQILKAATSIGANCMEAQNAESDADFIHKFKIAAKEGEETEYWLLLCEHSPQYPNCSSLLIAVEKINNIIGKILSTSHRNKIR